MASGGEESIIVEWRGEFSAFCKWSVSNFSKIKARALWSKYFEVGGFDCRLLVYPKGGNASGGGSNVLSGKFTWKVHNFSLFKEMIRTQIMSPVFPVGECSLRISVYQSSVNGVEYLSVCLESKDTKKSSGTTVLLADSCWCLFRMSVLNQKPGLNHMRRDSYERFAADNKSGYKFGME